LKDTLLPVGSINEQNSKKGRRVLKGVLTYATNMAKFKAAEEYCASRGWSFKVLTEQHLFPKMTKKA